MNNTLRFTSVQCEKNDIVRVASIKMDVLPNLYKVFKKGKNTVYLAPVNSDEIPSAWHKSRVIEIVDKEKNHFLIDNTVNNNNNSNEVVFDLEKYLSTFSSGYELWVRKRKSTYTNILIESDKKTFWYFKTDETGRPKKKFFGSIPQRIGRHCKNLNYDKKIVSLTSQGFTRKK